MQRRMLGWPVIMKWKGCGRKRSQPDYWRNTGNCLEGVRKKVELCSDIRFPGRDLKPGSLDHESRVLQNRRQIQCFVYSPFRTLQLCIVFISVFSQLNAQNLFYNKFYFVALHVSSTCAHHQGVKIALHSLWYHHTYRCDDTRGCVMQFWPSGDKHLWSKHVEAIYLSN